MVEYSDGPDIRELERLADLLDRVGEDDERRNKLLRAAALDSETHEEVRTIYQQKAAQTVAKDVFYPYELMDGPFRIGTNPDGRPIGLTHEQVNEHLLLVGMTGSGKTTFFYNLMNTAVAHDVPFLVFDFKNDYRHLVAHQDLLVLNWRDFKFNPLKPPPGVQPGKWGEILADTFAHATDLLIGSESYFLEKLRNLYELYDTNTGSTQYPSLFELRDLVNADQVTKASPKFKYKERVASRLSMMTGFSGDIFDCSAGYPIEELLTRNVAFELKEPNQYVTNFVVEALLTWIFYYRDAMGQRQKLRHFIMFDEAKRVFDVNRSRQPASGYPPIDDLVGKVREFGEALVVADHEPSKLSDSLKANTYAKLWLTLGSGTDISEIARTFGIERDAVDFTRTMTKGEALLKLADMEPVPILLPDYQLDKTMTENEIRTQMAPVLETLTHEERARPKRFQQVIGTWEEEEDKETVGAVAEALLASVIDQPFLNMSKRYDYIEVDTKKGNAAKTELVTAAAFTDNTPLTWQIKRVLTVKAIQHQRQPFDEQPPHIPPFRDRLALGTTITGSTYEIEQDTVAQHVLAVGQSGVGKTTLFYNVMDQLTVPFWVFDLKQDYRHLVQHDDELLVLPWTELKFNPLQPPPGVPPRRWAQVFNEIFGHATALLSGSKNYLMKQLIELYQRYDLFDAVEPPYPSLHDLQQLFKEHEINYVRKTANYRDTVVNRLEAMNLTAGTVFDCSEGYPLEELLQRNVVFEFDGLGTDLQNFLMEILFAAVYEYRVAQNQRGGDLRHVFFLDEGKQVFSVYKERQDAAGIPAIDKLTAKMREFGEGLVVADQEATKLTDSIKANTNTTLLLATGDAVQFAEVAESMNLTDRQQDVAQTLGIGEAIVQTGRRDPCPVILTNYELAKTVSDTELRKRQQQEWNTFSATPREPITKVAEEVSQSDQDAVDVPDDPVETTVTVSDRAEQLLTDIVQRPFVTVTDRYDRFSSVHQGNEAKKELLDAGFVEEQQVTTATGTRTLFELTETGREYAETCLEMDAKQRGRGGITHRYWQHRLTELFNEAGWSAKRELFDADVYVNLHDAELVIEIAMTIDDREVDHVKRHLETGFDRIWVVCRNGAVRDGLQERLQENGLLRDCVDLRLLQDIRSMDDLSL